MKVLARRARKRVLDRTMDIDLSLDKVIAKRKITANTITPGCSQDYFKAYFPEVNLARPPKRARTKSPEKRLTIDFNLDEILANHRERSSLEIYNNFMIARNTEEFRALEAYRQEQYCLGREELLRTT